MENNELAIVNERMSDRVREITEKMKARRADVVSKGCSHYASLFSIPALSEKLPLGDNIDGLITDLNNNYMENMELCKKIRELEIDLEILKAKKKERGGVELDFSDLFDWYDLEEIKKLLSFILDDMLYKEDQDGISEEMRLIRQMEHIVRKINK